MRRRDVRRLLVLSRGAPAIMRVLASLGVEGGRFARHLPSRGERRRSGAARRCVGAAEIAREMPVVLPRIRGPGGRISEVGLGDQLARVR